jgi:hypothetical protein
MSMNHFASRPVVRFFDRLEDRVRGKLSHFPILYAFIGSIGVVLCWRGVWGIADLIPVLNNPYVSLLASLLVMLPTGLFVSFFIGDTILLSGLRREKKLVEKNDAELAREGREIADIAAGVTEESVEIMALRDEIRELRALLNASRPK